MNTYENAPAPTGMPVPTYRLGDTVNGYVLTETGWHPQHVIAQEVDKRVRRGWWLGLLLPVPFGVIAAPVSQAVSLKRLRAARTRLGLPRPLWKDAMPLAVTVLVGATLLAVATTNNVQRADTYRAPTTYSAPAASTWAEWGRWNESNLRLAQDGLTDAAAAAGIQDADGAARGATLAASALRSVSESPDGGVVSGHLHDGADHLDDAAGAMRAGDIGAAASSMRLAREATERGFDAIPR
jgi:hypothetical protein